MAEDVARFRLSSRSRSRSSMKSFNVRLRLDGPAVLELGPATMVEVDATELVETLEMAEAVEAEESVENDDEFEANELAVDDLDKACKDLDGLDEG